MAAWGVSVIFPNGLTDWETGMNLLSMMKEKSKSAFPAEFYPNIEAVIHNIEIANIHMEKAKSQGDYYYTDVIYRTNQAFDTALYVAYKLLVGNDPKEKSPQGISEYFERNAILTDIVLTQLVSYRDQWKKRTSHNQQVFFSQQEALLAIVSVSAFFNVLLDNMLERVAHENEKNELSKVSFSLMNEVKNYNDLTLPLQVVEIINKFSHSLIDELKNNGDQDLSEYEVLGKLTGFIASIDPEISIETGKVIPIGVSSGRVDLFLEKKGQNVIVELNSASSHPIKRAKEGREKIRNLMLASGIDNGLVFIAPGHSNCIMKVMNDVSFFDNRNLKTVVIYPSLVAAPGQGGSSSSEAVETQASSA